MTAMRIIGTVLLALGLACFLTAGGGATQNTTPAQPDSPELTLTESETVVVPQWISLGAMVLGGMVLVLGFRRP